MIRARQTDLLVGHATHPGETGKNNEDNYTIVAFEPLAGSQTITTLAVVADGVGGNLAGEVASEKVVNAIVETFTQARNIGPQVLFTEGFAAAQRKLIEYVEQNPDIKNMSTTMVAAAVVNRRLYIAWLGDSRIYLLRNGQIRQLTVDHTVLQDAVERGIMTPDQAKESNVYQHVIQRYISIKSDVTPDFRLRLNPGESDEQAITNQGLPLLPGDRVLLCSDGLHDLVEAEEIGEVLQSYEVSQQAVDKLVLMARERGGHDNITIVMFEVPDTQSKRAGLFAGAALASIGLGVLALILVAALAIWAYTALLRDDPTPVPTTIPPTATLIPPTATSIPLTATFVPPTVTPIPPTATPAPPTATYAPSTVTPIPLTATPDLTATGQQSESESSELAGTPLPEEQSPEETQTPAGGG